MLVTRPDLWTGLEIIWEQRLVELVLLDDVDRGGYYMYIGH